MEDGCLKRTYLRVLSVLLIFAIFTVVFTGCNNDAANNNLPQERPAYVHVPEFVSLDSLTDELPNIGNLVFVGDVLFFTSVDTVDIDSEFHVARLFSLNMENNALTELPNYSTTEKPYNADGGWIYITNLLSDNDDNLWVMETGGFFYFDIPGHLNLDDLEDDEVLEYRTDFGSFTAVRKLDNTGAELLSVDLNQVTGRQNVIGLFTFSVDYDNNIYVGSGSTIFTLNPDSGDILFTLEVDGFVNRLIRLYDGSVAHFGWDDRSGTMLLRRIDPQGRTWGEDIALPFGIQNIFAGNEDYLVFITDGASLLGVEMSTNNVVQISDLVGSGILPPSIRNVNILPDERILLTVQTQEHDNDFRATDFLFLSLVPADMLEERVVLTLASWLTNPNVQGAVAQFNATSTTHVIEIIDYGEDDLGQFVNFNTALERLILDLNTGRTPDIFDFSNLLLPNFADWANTDLFIDLYPLIDADPILSRDDFITGVLRSVETSDRLYRAPYFFTIITLVGDAEVVGDSVGWTFGEFMEVINNNPQATYPIIDRLSSNREGFLNTVLTLGMDDFVDWESGTTYFDSDEFIELLEFAYNAFSINEFNWNIDYEELFSQMDMRPEDIISGRTIVARMSFHDLSAYSWYREVFGGEFVFKGFPASDGGGSMIGNDASFAISSTSDDVQMAWEFIRTFLTFEGQRRNVEFGLPTNKEWFDVLLAQSMNENISGTVGMNDFHVELSPITSDEAEQIMELVNSLEFTTGRYYMLWNIVIESATDYWNGQISAQDAARIIQNRASRYVSERHR